MTDQTNSGCFMLKNVTIQPLNMTTIRNAGEDTLSAKLKSILPNCDQIDALVGYFYFSGFQDLHNELKDKKIRILVGMDMDKEVINHISAIKSAEFDPYTKPTSISSRSTVRRDYINELARVFNDSDIFDNEQNQTAFDIFLEKIKDGSLEIRKTFEPNHSKNYILHYATEFAEKEEVPGVVITGSSNLSYQGLRGRRESNQMLTEAHYYKRYSTDFEEDWANSDNITIADATVADEFISEVKKKIWLYQLPNPKLLYYRVLDEYFSIDEIGDVKTASDITGGQFSSLKYQTDAIKLGIDRINRYGGVIVADVVGLGKSIIASAIAHNLNCQTIVIAPPHLADQWNDYKAQFNFNGFVYTTGKIEEALKRHGDSDRDLLIILDEAHKHRNEDTENYKLLHRLCSGNKVMALSATPFNNDPKDIYALIKLFSTPGQSTLKTVENISTAFYELFTRYKKVRKNISLNSGKKDPNLGAEIKKESEYIATQLRKMIEPLVIRRSRLDLAEIEDYRTDLESQGIAFAEVGDPEIMEYDLGGISDLYQTTLHKISSSDKGQSFEGIRYKPASYIKPDSSFVKKLVADSDDGEDDSFEVKMQAITQAQVNVAKFMRRLLVRRFESSMQAFLISLDNMISSSELMLDWYDNRQYVPIYKKADLPTTADLDDKTPEEVDALFSRLEGKGLMQIPADDMTEDFRPLLVRDIELLQEIKKEWSKLTTDPKLEYFKTHISSALENEPNRKIVVFTEFSDTANYISQTLKKSGFDRIFKYSSEDASKEAKEIIKTNFDAGLKEDQQKNDYDVIIATDAISEGYNLHRAGAIINYDIPYNPTRVIQRVGRINRINKKVFDKLFIYNFFPTDIGESETSTRAISTLKMNLIHSLMGEDTKIFEEGEELQNYFAKQYREEKNKHESLSWDAKYRNEWNLFKDNQEVMEKVRAIPHRARIARKHTKTGVLTFAKRDSSYIFAFGETPETAQIIAPEVGLELFDNIQKDEQPEETTANFESVYQVIKEHIFKDNTKPSLNKGRRADAVDRVKVIKNLYAPARDLCDDIIRVIHELDSLPLKTLREITELKINKEDMATTFKMLQEIVPLEYLENILNTAKQAEGTSKVVVLSEELIKI